MIINHRGYELEILPQDSLFIAVQGEDGTDKESINIPWKLLDVEDRVICQYLYDMMSDLVPHFVGKVAPQLVTEFTREERAALLALASARGNS